VCVRRMGRCLPPPSVGLGSASADRASPRSESWKIEASPPSRPERRRHPVITYVKTNGSWGWRFGGREVLLSARDLGACGEVCRAMERWEVVESRVEFLGGPFAIRKARAVLPSSGVAHEFILFDSPDWVNVVPVTDGGKIVMVRQHRLGTDRMELEIPGGLVDPQDGDTLEAAKRELLEETGYGARSWIFLGSVSPNPALQGNRCHTFLAQGCRKEREPQPDSTESLEVTEVRLAELPRLIAAGEISHGLVLNALFWYYLQQGRLRI